MATPNSRSPKMKRNTNSSTQQLSSSRCTYMTASGRRCRMSASPGSLYCFSHAKNNVIVASTLAAELSHAAGSLGAPEDVHRVLAKIFLALAEDRLSTRKAAVLGYLGQMLLRSHREIAFHKKLADEEAKRNNSGHLTVIDIPGMTDEAPAVTAPSQPSPPTNHNSFSPVVTAPQTQPASTEPATTPAQAAPPSANEPNPAPAPAKNPSTARPSSDPSQPYPPLPDLNHFYPRDPTLRPGLQQPRNTTVYPDEEELRWSELTRRYASTRRRTL